MRARLSLTTAGTHAWLALTVGQVTVFGGNPDLSAAQQIVQSLPRTIATPETQSWHDLICEVHGAKIEKRRRTEFTSERLDAAQIDEFAKNLTSGLRIEEIDRDLAEQLGSEVGDGFFGKFDSVEHFLKIGIGYCGIVDQRVVCGATSAVVCKRGISIQIETHPAYRRMGLATSVGATLISHCLQNGIDPHWSAATSISAALAEKLGYSPNDSFDELIIPA